MAYAGTRQRVAPALFVIPSAPGFTWPDLGTANTYCNSMAWSPDGQFLAIAVISSPYLVVLRVINGVIVEKMANPASLPSGRCDGVAWNNAGTYIATVSTTVSPYTEMWAWSTAGFGAKVSPPATIPANGRQCLAWSSDDAYLAVGGFTTAPLFDIYNATAGYGSRLATPASAPVGDVRALAWISNTDILLGVGATPYIEAYPVSAGVIGAKRAAAGAAAGVVWGLALSADQKMVMAATDTTPFGQMYLYEAGWTAGPAAIAVPLSAQATGIAVDKVLDQFIMADNTAASGKLYVHGSPHRAGAYGTIAGQSFNVPAYSMQSRVLALSPNRKYLAAFQANIPYVRIISWLVEDY